MTTTTAVTFIQRRCPVCCAEEHRTLFEITVHDFSTVNPTYRIDQLERMGIAGDHSCPIACCEQCGFVYSKDCLDDRSLSFLYEHVIDHEKSLAKIHGREKRKRLLAVWARLFELATEHRDRCDLDVFDFGCGWGDFLSVARSQCINVCGLEADRVKVDWAAGQGLNIVSTLQEVEALAPFDVVYCDQVLEHLDTPAETVRFLFGILKPGGVVFVGVPCCPKVEMDAVAAQLRLGRQVSKDINPWEHLNYFSPDSLVRLMQTTGFEVLNLKTDQSRLSWLSGFRKQQTAGSPDSRLASSTDLFCRKPPGHDAQSRRSGQADEFPEEPG
ncbi:MAG: class I SAM-dependent methyltransferase [Fuerstiella sp.]|nr:class I SAM-dependent methyltransferase [Fuerstiella sp.]